MSFYFLPEDFKKLNAQIQEISDRIKAIGQEMGLSCQEGAETYHDNFAYEDGERQQRMWSWRLKELVDIIRLAKMVEPGKSTETVAIGSHVTFLDLETNEEKIIRIGSYFTFSKNETVSYCAPLARIMLGAKEGDICEGLISGKKKKLEIVSVD